MPPGRRSAERIGSQTTVSCVLRLIFQCKVCGREHRVPGDFRNRWVDPPKGSSGKDEDRVHVFPCDRRDESRLYSRGEILWAERQES